MLGSSSLSPQVPHSQCRQLWGACRPTAAAAAAACHDSESLSQVTVAGQAAMYSNSPATLARSRMALPSLYCCEGSSALSCNTLQRCQSTCECTRFWIHISTSGARCHVLQLASDLCTLQDCLVLLRGLLCADLQNITATSERSESMLVWCHVLQLASHLCALWEGLALLVLLRGLLCTELQHVAEVSEHV